MTAFARKCPFYGTQCFVHGARRIAEAAHVVVTNHSLMFCDLAADGGLLPRFDTGSSMRPMVRRTKRAERFRLIYLPTISRVSCAAFRRALGRVACSTGPSETSSFRMSKGDALLRASEQGPRCGEEFSSCVAFFGEASRSALFRTREKRA